MPDGRPPSAEDDASTARPRFRCTRWLRDRQASVMLPAILLLILASPVEDRWPTGHLLLAPTVMLVLLAAVLYSRPHPWIFRLALCLAVAWIATSPGFSLFPIGGIGSSLIMLAIVVLTLVMMIRHVIDARQPDWETLSAALSGYLILGAIWTQLYLIFLQVDPGSFRGDGLGRSDRSTMLYFSFQALTTLGLGDIAPISPFVRMLTIVEAAVGQFYIATIIARLATLATLRRD